MVTVPCSVVLICLHMAEACRSVTRQSETLVKMLVGAPWRQPCMAPTSRAHVKICLCIVPRSWCRRGRDEWPWQARLRVGRQPRDGVDAEGCGDRGPTVVGSKHVATGQTVVVNRDAQHAGDALCRGPDAHNRVVDGRYGQTRAPCPLSDSRGRLRRPLSRDDIQQEDVGGVVRPEPDCRVVEDRGVNGARHDAHRSRRDGGRSPRPEPPSASRAPLQPAKQRNGHDNDECRGGEDPKALSLHAHITLSSTITGRSLRV